MKLFKKTILILYILLVIPLLIGCDAFSIYRLNTTTTETSTIESTLPITVNGTITFTEGDYDSYPNYVSPAYSITDINEYNQLLYDTKEHIRHANIQIASTLYSTVQVFPWSTATQKQIYSVNYGSGFVFKEDSQYFYAITNFHVINPESYDAEYKIKTFSDTYEHDAEVVAFDSSKDLAVLKFTKDNRQDVEMINITNRLYYKFTPGELVMAVGNPESIENNVTFGKFKSMEDISQYLDDQTLDFKVIYHDATIHPGSSGGALVDVEGNLLGVNTWGDSTNDENSFSVPNYIVYEFLINKGILS